MSTMRVSPRNFAALLAALLAAGALTFGTAQAFATPSAPGVAASCNIFQCFQACQERYGEGAQPYCDKWGDCQCIL
jgi:hypothetical protein